MQNNNTSVNILPEAKKVFFVGSNFSGKAMFAGSWWLNFNDDAYSGFTVDNSGEVVAEVKARITILTVREFLGSEDFAQFVRLLKLAADVTACVVDTATVVATFLAFRVIITPPQMAVHCAAATQPIVDLLRRHT